MISTKDILSYRENSKQFDVKYSQLIKGIAVLLLFLHHVLSPSYPYTTLIIPQETLNPLVSLGKICVPIFFILSGYGMYLSYWRSKNPGISNDVEYIAKHVIKLIFSFWIIYILFVPLSLIFHYDFTEIYSRSGSFIGNMFSDFLGLAYVLQTPSVNNTWWYLGVSLVFYVISPLVFRLIKKFSRYLFFIFLLIVIVTFNFYGLRGLVIYFIPYILGAICAEKDFFNQLYHFKNNHEYLKQFFLALIFVSFVYVRQVHLINDVKFYKIDWIFALIIIYFGYYYISTESLFGKSLISLGRESGNIFFLHSFFYAFWFKNIIYPVLKYGILICSLLSRQVK